MKKTVGRFTIDGETIIGPAEYMAEQGNAKLERICAGTDTVFNMSSHLSPNIETAVLVALQTDYAGWSGSRDFFRGVAGDHKFFQAARPAYEKD